MKADKRYLVFGYESYYPSGSMSDLIESYDLYTDTIAFIYSKKDYELEHYQVYDRILGYELLTVSKYSGYDEISEFNIDAGDWIELSNAEFEKKYSEALAK